ncbi:hypothetical protein CKO38_14585, partial [Rhodospirillum rubrum]|nr:hypothetical protein [Rhodospirillum rubrum]
PPPAVAVAPAPDVGAMPAYTQPPDEPPPETPSDCVGAHPYYMTYPPCVIARKMGLLTPGPGGGPSEIMVRQVAPAGTTMAPPGSEIPAEGGAAATVQDKASAEGAVARTIGPLPEGADQAAAAAASAMRGRLAEEEANRQAKEAARKPFDWGALFFWIAVAFGGLLAIGGGGLAALMVRNRLRLTRAARPDDPYAGYFEEAETTEASKAAAKGKGKASPKPAAEPPLDAFEEHPDGDPLPAGQ